MPQAPAGVKRESITFLSVKWKTGDASEICGLFFSLPGSGVFSCVIWKLMGARWPFRRQCIKLQAILALIEEFLDLGCLHVFKLYFVVCFEVSLGFETSVLKFPWVMFSSFFLYDRGSRTGIGAPPLGLSSVALLGLLFLLAAAGCW